MGILVLIKEECSRKKRLDSEEEILQPFKGRNNLGATMVLFLHVLHLVSLVQWKHESMQEQIEEEQESAELIKGSPSWCQTSGDAGAGL